ncbi:hypothetical protein VPH35_056279 [Triticum aestivum]
MVESTEPSPRNYADSPIRHRPDHPLLGMVTEDQDLQLEDILSFTTYKAYIANTVELILLLLAGQGDRGSLREGHHSPPPPPPRRHIRSPHFSLSLQINSPYRIRGPPP